MRNLDSLKNTAICAFISDLLQILYSQLLLLESQIICLIQSWHSVANTLDINEKIKQANKKTHKMNRMENLKML